MGLFGRESQCGQRVVRTGGDTGEMVWFQSTGPGACHVALIASLQWMISASSDANILGAYTYISENYPISFSVAYNNACLLHRMCEIPRFLELTRISRAARWCIV